MALSESGTTNISSPDYATHLDSAKISDDKSIVVYRLSNGSVAAYGRIADASGALSVGSAQEFDSGADISYPHVQRLSNSLAVMSFTDDDNSGRPTLRTLSVTGTTITENAKEEVDTIRVAGGDQHRMATISASTGVIAYRSLTGPAHKLARFTVSGGTVTAATPVDHTEMGLPLGMEALDSSKVLYFYQEVDVGYPTCQVLDISSGVTQGTPSENTAAVSTGTFNSRRTVVRLANNKAVVCFKRTGTPTAISAFVVNTSGNSISSFGALFDLITDNDADVVAVSALSATKILFFYEDGANQSIIESASIDGSDVITLDGDSVTLSQGYCLNPTVPVVQDGVAIAFWSNASTSQGNVAKISGVPIPEAVSQVSKLHYDIDTLTYRTDLPFTVPIRSMAVDNKYRAAIGNESTGTSMVVQGSVDNSYASYDDITYDIDDSSGIKVLRWV